VNLGAHYDLTKRIQITAEIDNLFDRRYATAAQLAPTAFTNTGTFAARPLREEDGEFPVTRSTFYAPGAPRAVLVTTRVSF
jgi:outer membrane receptor protein involved in Fe transport